MKNKFFFLICLMFLSGAIIFLPKEASAHSNWGCNGGISYTNLAGDTYVFTVCGWQESGAGNELTLASNGGSAFWYWQNGTGCGNVTSSLTSYTQHYVDPCAGVTPSCGVCGGSCTPGACGSTNGTNQTWPSGGWCNAGSGPYWTQTGDVSNGNVWGWTCNDGGGNASCSFIQQCQSGTYLKNGVCSTNGVCGTATNNGSTLPAPTTNLCSVGNASGVTNNTSSYDWSCAGTGNGTSLGCSTTHNTCSVANKTNYPTCDICTSGNQLCSNGSCIPNSSTCPVCTPITLTPHVSPGFVSTPSGLCTVTTDPFGNGYTDGSGICKSPVVCTIDGTKSFVSGDKISVGTHSLSCTDTWTTKTASVKCLVSPIYGEF